jgi:hypothetical protein
MHPHPLPCIENKPIDLLLVKLIQYLEEIYLPGMILDPCDEGIGLVCND